MLIKYFIKTVLAINHLNIYIIQPCLAYHKMYEQLLCKRHVDAICILYFVRLLMFYT